MAGLHENTKLHVTRKLIISLLHRFYPWTWLIWTVSFSLLATLFCRSIEGFWFRILSSDDGFDDICTATGLPWQDLLPLLMDVGVIVDKTTSVVKRFRVVHKQWNEIANTMAKNVRLEVTVVQERDKGLSYFFCLGQPKFNPPLQERKNRRSPELVRCPCLTHHTKRSLTQK